MKQALCIDNNIEIINEFFYEQNADSKITAKFVDRGICEKVDSGLFQIIPYISFFTFNNNGKAIFLKYTRPNNSAEQRLKDKVSIGLGGHIDQAEEVVYSTKSDDEFTVFTMNKEQFMKTVLNAAVREVKEELPGIPEYIIDKIYNNTDRFVIFNDNSNDVGKVHLCCLIAIELDQVTFGQLLDESIINKDEIGSIGVISIDVGNLLVGFNISRSTQEMLKELNEEYDIESWSSISINIITNGIAETIVHDITFDDIKKLVLDKLKNTEISDSSVREEDKEPVVM